MVVGVGSKKISGSFLEVIEKQGWQGLWAGNAINMIRIVPTQAIELATFECVKRVMTSTKEKWDKEESPSVQLGPVKLSFNLSWVSPIALGGAAAGFVSTLACHPLEVLKVNTVISSFIIMVFVEKTNTIFNALYLCNNPFLYDHYIFLLIAKSFFFFYRLSQDRLTVSPDVYPNLSIAVQKMYANGGIGSFYSGLSPTLIGMLPYSTCYYFMYDTIKNTYCTAQNKKCLSRPEMLLIGALSGALLYTCLFLITNQNCCYSK